MDYHLNPLLRGFRSLRCGSEYDIADYFEGCKKCQKEGFPASLEAIYKRFPDQVSDNGKRGCARYGDWLTYRTWPSLGEGGTALVSLNRSTAELGLSDLLLKNEGQNPTGSHKDRMSMLTVARARDIGADTVIAASSGNAGVSLAAYAAAAGLTCEIVTTPKMNPNWRRAIEVMGARLVATEQPLARWSYVRDRVRNDGYYPATNYLTPPVGSNPFGVDGYKTIALELHEELDAASIDAVLVPTSRADLLWGICRGFMDLKLAGLTSTVPRVHAVEPFPRISSVLQGRDYRGQFPGTSLMVSIGGTTVAHQALYALELCGGTAVAVREADVVDDQRHLAKQGLYLELSCAATLTGLRKLLHQGEVSEGDTVVLIGSSHGFKEYEETDRSLPLVG